MNEDYLGLEDAAERKAAAFPAFVSAAPMGPRELQVAEQMHRMADLTAASSAIIFTLIDEETGQEVWDPPSRGKIGEGEKWRALMRWPVTPSIQQAQAFQSNAIARRLAEWWDRLAAARLLDDEFGYDNLDDKQKPPR